MNNNVYEIIIKDETSGGRGKSAVAGEKESISSDTEIATWQEGVKRTLVAADKLKPFVNQAISHSNNMVYIETGKNEYYQRLQFNHQVANELISTAEYALTGFVLSGGNPIGAAVGLGIKGLTWLVNYENKREELGAKAAVEYTSIQMRNVRAGYSQSRGAKQ